MNHNLKLERALIGAMITSDSGRNIALTELEAGDFYHRDHQAAFEAIQAASDAGKGVDLLLVSRSIDSRPETLLWLSEAASEATLNVREAVEVIRDDAYRRGEYDRARLLVTDIEKGVETEILQRKYGLTTPKAKAAIEGADVILGSVIDYMTMAAESERRFLGLETGFSELDLLLNGLEGPCLYVIAARPSIGKSALSMQIAAHVAEKEKKPVVIFSLEMSKQQIMTRLVCGAAGVDMQRFRSGTLNDEETGRVCDAASDLANRPIYICDQPGLTPGQAQAHLTSFTRNHDIGLVVVDYIQLMQGRGEGEVERTTDVSQALKGIAMHFNVPVIALSQLNRECEKRNDKKPSLADLRSSGSIEQDADTVILIHRPGFYGLSDRDGNVYGGETYLLVEKQRQGPTGTVPLIFLEKQVKFAEFIWVEGIRQDDPEAYQDSLGL